MIVMNKKPLFGILLLLTTSCYADSISSVCSLKEPNQIEMIECAAQRYDKYDSNLNIVYQHKIKQLTKVKASELKSLQRAWVSKKEANCNIYSEEESGSNGRLESLECSTEMTQERIKFLKQYK